MREGSRSHHTGAAALTVVAVLMGVSAASARPVSIVNGTRTAMVALQVRPSDAPVWRPDILNHRPLGIQKQIGFEVGPACFFDVKAMFEDGHRINKQHVNLCKSTTYLLTDF
ncbi:MAG TPA: hypothetical protein VMD53_18770 [Rhizomicrobium sp.]|nr:hypothetical protein [Rhizomicrobium sp.]